MTSASHEALNNDELNWLNEFFLDRSDDNADTEGLDKGILDILALDGLLTAIVSGPMVIPPALWLPQIWGDLKPPAGTELKAHHATLLFSRHMNALATTLQQSPKKLEPLFTQKTLQNKSQGAVDTWCEGYMRGVSLATEQWDLDNIEIMVLIAPITAFHGKQAAITYQQLNQTEINNLHQSIPFHAREIYTYWSDRRDVAPVILPPGSNAPRTGRDDPCPCGSGKPYKKCCLH
ncbi:MAG: UPF0149 family protein [Gammaproteobacteria bacterium]|nr:UPF0149 family protein [Gammaproteobacteria bacterium]